MAIAGIDRYERRRSKIVVSLLLIGMIGAPLATIGIPLAFIALSTASPPDGDIAMRVLHRKDAKPDEDISGLLTDLLAPLKTKRQAHAYLKRQGFACSLRQPSELTCESEFGGFSCATRWTVSFDVVGDEDLIFPRARSRMLCP